MEIYSFGIPIIWVRSFWYFQFFHFNKIALHTKVSCVFEVQTTGSVWNRVRKDFLIFGIPKKGIAIFNKGRKGRQKKLKRLSQNSNNYHTPGITPKHVTSAGAHLCGLVPGQHSSEETSPQWRTVGDIVSDLSDSQSKPNPLVTLAVPLTTTPSKPTLWNQPCIALSGCRTEVPCTQSSICRRVLVNRRRSANV